MEDYKSHGAPQGGGGPSFAGPGRMTREMEVVLAAGVGNGYRCVEGEGALVFVDPVSSLGDPIVGNTDSSASSPAPP